MLGFKTKIEKDPSYGRLIHNAMIYTWQVITGMGKGFESVEAAHKFATKYTGNVAQAALFQDYLNFSLDALGGLGGKVATIVKGIKISAETARHGINAGIRKAADEAISRLKGALKKGVGNRILDTPENKILLDAIDKVSSKLEDAIRSEIEYDVLQTNVIGFAFSREYPLRGSIEVKLDLNTARLRIAMEGQDTRGKGPFGKRWWKFYYYVSAQVDLYSNRIDRLIDLNANAECAK